MIGHSYNMADSQSVCLASLWSVLFSCDEIVFQRQHLEKTWETLQRCSRISFVQSTTLKSIHGWDIYLFNQPRERQIKGIATLIQGLILISFIELICIVYNCCNCSFQSKLGVVQCIYYLAPYFFAKWTLIALSAFTSVDSWAVHLKVHLKVCL